MKGYHLLIIILSCSAISAFGQTAQDQTRNIDTTKILSAIDAVPMVAYYNIQFEFNSSALKIRTYPILDVTSLDLRTSGASCEIDGYASSEGTAAHNMHLSRDRAIAVKTYLVNSGVSAKKLKVKGFGETYPVADNSTEAGRILNRRVEFHKKH
jgi:OOP family OmpA-OmpF porin